MKNILYVMCVYEANIIIFATCNIKPPIESTQFYIS